MEIGRCDVTVIIYNKDDDRPVAVYGNKMVMDIIRAGARAESYGFEEVTEALVPTVILRKVEVK